MNNLEKDVSFNKNEDQIKLMISNLNLKLDKIYLGGGKEKINKQKFKGKLGARERIDLLLDKGLPKIEIGALAGYEMYKEHGGCPAGGVIVIMGYIHQKLCVVVANDPTVKAGAWFPITGKKNLRAQEIAMENRIPIIYLVDSAGVYLPLQDEIFPDKDHFGRVFRNNAKMSAMGVIQIAAIMGSCVAGGAYLPIMSDESLIVDKTGTIFLAGSYLVKAAVGEIIDNETLGGATTHSEISGVVDYKSPDDKTCLKTIRNLLDKISGKETLKLNRSISQKPKLKMEDFYGTFPFLRSSNYDVKNILNFFIDNGDFTEYKSNYGKTIVCGYARIEGWSVGIVANQRKVVKTSKSEMQFGGVIYSDSASKASRFIMNCNQKKIPLVFFRMLVDLWLVVDQSTEES
jgi:acetyl-CoA carboxylase carboxyltransferase component